MPKKKRKPAVSLSQRRRYAVMDAAAKRKQMPKEQRMTLELHECESSHVPKDLACKSFEEGANGRCVYCDHEKRCHPGPGNAGPLGKGGDL